MFRAEERFYSSEMCSGYAVRATGKQVGSKGVGSTVVSSSVYLFAKS